VCLTMISLLFTSCTAKPTAYKVATDATWPPFESVNEQTKKIEGFDIDLMDAIAQKEGLQIEYVNVGFDPLLAGVASEQYDAAISSITITEDRKKDMLFLRPVFSSRANRGGAKKQYYYNWQKHIIR